MVEAVTRKIAVFCSANEVSDPQILAAAESFAQGLVDRKWELLYGGARFGLMGHFANKVIEAGGVARGAITKGLAEGNEGLHPGLKEAVIVQDLFERKRWFMREADAFAIFPGGFGTLDEALEVITWKALGEHSKPILFVNVAGFWHDQLKAFEGFSKRGMIREGGLSLYAACDNVDQGWAVLNGIDIR